MPTTDWFRRRRSPLIVAGVVIAIAVVTFLTVRSGTREGGDTLPQATPSTTAAAGPNAELLRLFDAGRKARYSVTYASSGPSGRSTVRLWRRPPLERVDTESGTGDQTRRISKIVSTTGPVACEQSIGGPWACRTDPGGGSGAVSDILSATIVAQISALQVEARDERIGGQATRCFEVRGRQGPPAELCLTAHGIPARVVAGDVRLELNELDPSPPPDSVFVPPEPAG